MKKHCKVCTIKKPHDLYGILIIYVLEYSFIFFITNDVKLHLEMNSRNV